MAKRIKDFVVQAIEENDLVEKDPAMEYPDPTPVHIPGKSDIPPPLTLREEMRRFVREEVSRAAANHEVETFEEADDFEIDEEPDLTTPYSVRYLTQPDAPESDLEGEPTPEDLIHAERGEAPETASKAVSDNAAPSPQTAPHTSAQ